MTFGRSAQLIIGTATLMSAMAVGQMAPSHPSTQPVQSSPHGQMTVRPGRNPHGTGRSTLKAFAAECGVTDMSESRVQILAAKSDGKWRSLPAKAEGESTDINAARAWKDEKGAVRVVDLSRTNAAGDELQMSRMCFSTQGSLRRLAERYVNIPACACGRSTDIAYDEQGKQTKSEQKWYKVPSQEKLGVEALKNAPKVIEYKTLSALPFANLLKEKNASTH